ncbi:hypothetical protein N7470_008183 [Penicillium chermesinum]|nr:hypothetical protein N7470_008183 [Penicillium chermesinum]
MQAKESGHATLRPDKPGGNQPGGTTDQRDQTGKEQPSPTVKITQSAFLCLKSLPFHQDIPVDAKLDFDFTSRTCIHLRFSRTRGDVPPNLQNAPEMAPMNASIPDSPRRGHNRSISNPFSSPFKKKVTKQATWDSDSDSDDITYPAHTLATSPRKDGWKGGTGKETVEGKCQTCNSTVRWPRESQVFRCTTCLMVTDLEKEPPGRSKDRDATDSSRLRGREKPLPPVPSENSPPLPADSQPGPVLSVSQARYLIDGCLSAYFESLLEEPRARLAPDDHRTTRPHTKAEVHVASAGPGSHQLNVPRDPRNRSASLSHSSDRERSDSAGKERENVSSIFKRLEDHIIAAFKGCGPLNSSFPVYQQSARSASSGNPPRTKVNPAAQDAEQHAPLFEPDAKTLLLGDVAENSTWWMTEWAKEEGRVHSSRHASSSSSKARAVSSRSPRINWGEMNQWYQLVLHAGSTWVEKWSAKKPDAVDSEADLIRSKRWDSVDLSMIEEDITCSRLHLQRTLMKATENLLKRPRQVLKRPEDTRFLFILISNPMLSSPGSFSNRTPVSHRDHRHPSHPRDFLRPNREGKSPQKEPAASNARSGESGHHYGPLKRILGLMSNLPNDCHHYFVSWMSRFSPAQLERLVDLVGGFVTYRLTRQHGSRKRSEVKDVDELIPSFASAAGNTPAELHAAINRRSPNRQTAKKKDTPVVYAEDWQIRAAARIMSLIFTANLCSLTRKPDGSLGDARSRFPAAPNRPGRGHGYLVPISSFYNTLLDYSDLIGDFETWESKSSKFAFCQYPFFLSIWAKIHILEHDARRQMEARAREAFFNSILNRRAVSQYLVLKVRRDCLVDDSLKGVSEVVGSGQEDIKKGLRIEFTGEEGIDAGGPREEWFLLLVREIFDPQHGLFIYDEDSKYCYFNPYCFESSEQFFLVGVLLGLAIYNSTILDVDLPPFAFKKLLAASPTPTAPQTMAAPPMKFKCTLDDLAEYRPALARGLRLLLDYEGDVAETFCYDFVAQVDRYGEVVIARQFEPFKRGFFTVCGGNALSLFRPEEIEQLVRGSDEPLDVNSLRAVATYDNWSHPQPESVPVVQWFWSFFETSPPDAQRKILSFITGSDRIPAMGATSLSIRLACLGDDGPRYPTARTCFNTLGLYRYSSRERFQRLLWDAVVNSEGFGLK